MSNDMLYWDLASLSNAIRKKEVSPVEITRKILDHIQVANKQLNAYITVSADEALAAASQAESEIIAGNIKGHLHGIPIALKDLIYTKDIKTTMGSEIYSNFIPDYDAAVVEKLKEAGAVILGKLNTHQFAYGTTGDRSYFGAIRNPYDTSKIAGGSSSGSGAAVAASLCYAALGTDTGGSIRIPSSFCGIVGMKPTFGRVSKYGVFPLCWTLDHVGPMTRTVKDNAIMLSVLSGYDQRDPYSKKNKAEDFTRFLDKGIKGRVIGVPASFYFDNVSEEVKNNIQQAIETFRKLGAKIKIIDIPILKDMTASFLMTLKSESYTFHKDELFSHPDQWDEEIRERLLTGSTGKADEYIRAQQIRKMAIQEFNKVLSEVEILITPTVPILPTDINQREVEINGSKEHVFSVLNRLTGPTSLIGFPSLSIPCGFSQSGLPIGLQLIGRPLDEANIYQFAEAFERESLFPKLKYEIT
jgi:aspartyl-tRNA(Asn)/glutamyl-tRNA(Gln) amidotransferase subunit A